MNWVLTICHCVLLTRGGGVVPRQPPGFHLGLVHVAGCGHPAHCVYLLRGIPSGARHTLPVHPPLTDSLPATVLPGCEMEEEEGRGRCRQALSSSFEGRVGLSWPRKAQSGLG